MSENSTEKPKAKRGFAVMDAARQQQIASLGGKIAHQKGVAHRWTKEEAAVAGKKGGHSSGIKKGAAAKPKDS